MVKEVIEDKREDRSIEEKLLVPKFAHPRVAVMLALVPNRNARIDVTLDEPAKHLAAAAGGIAARMSVIGRRPDVDQKRRDFAS